MDLWLRVYLRERRRRRRILVFLTRVPHTTRLLVRTQTLRVLRALLRFRAMLNLLCVWSPERKKALEKDPLRISFERLLSGGSLVTRPLQQETAKRSNLRSHFPVNERLPAYLDRSKNVGYRAHDPWERTVVVVAGQHTPRLHFRQVQA